MIPPASCKRACKRRVFDTFRYSSKDESSMPIRPPYGRNFRAISRSKQPNSPKYSLAARKMFTDFSG